MILVVSSVSSLLYVTVYFVRCFFVFFFSSRRRYTSFALLTGVHTCSLPIFEFLARKLAYVLPGLSSRVHAPALGPCCKQRSNPLEGPALCNLSDRKSVV